MAAFSALYNLQFDFGPLSDPQSGNVGMRPETSGWLAMRMLFNSRVLSNLAQSRAPWSRMGRQLSE
jgi:hypothetical protein